MESVRRYRGDTATATPVAGDELPGRRFEYRYDQAGNRRSSGVTGDSNGAVNVSGSGDEDYTSNAGNQYLFRENNAVQVSGTVASEANAAAVGAATFERRDRAWGAAYVPANASAAAKGSATVYAAIPGSTPLVRAETKEYFVPKRAQEFGYDYAGNLTHDSVWDYAYDAENRLVAMQHRGEAIGSGKLDNADVRRLEFTYDYLGRRVQKIVRSGWNGSAFTTVASNRKYLYEGWNVVAEFDATSTLTLVRSYTWGLDTAGSFTATGGVGALLQIRDEAQNKTLLPTYDGNGNVAALVDADSGAIAAAYEYGPFGEPLRAEGTYAAANPFRFSTKFTDEETGLVYYGHRYYSSVLGRFITRDPIGENGGVNLYGFVGNDGVNRLDYRGTFSFFTRPFLSIGFDADIILPPMRAEHRQPDYIKARLLDLYLNRPPLSPTAGNEGGGEERGETKKEPNNADKEREKLKKDCEERARLAAEGKNPTRWEGPVNYEFYAFIGSYGRFEGVLVANEPAARTARISGNLFGVGVQGGYVTGQIDRAVWIGNSAAEIRGANGAFFNFTIGVGAGPVDIIGFDAEIAAHRGPTNADVSSVQGAPAWPGLSTTFDPANPASYLEKPKVGLGGGGGVNGFQVRNFEITSDPCAGLN